MFRPLSGLSQLKTYLELYIISHIEVPANFEQLRLLRL
jgi:hypothetical protein